MTPRQKDALAFRTHWPRKELDAFGHTVPACNSAGSVQKKPRITHERHAVNCGLCVGIMNREGAYETTK